MEELEQLKEDLFLAQSDLQHSRTENTDMRNFIQTIYESCEHVKDTGLLLDELLENLKENIRIFAKDHNIRL